MDQPERQFVLPSQLRTSLLEYGRSDPIHEVCGLLGGAGLEAQSFYPVKNIAADRTSGFLMDAEEQIRAMRHMRLAGETLIGIFHTHPDSPAAPSAKDRELAAYPGVVYLILSLAGKTPVLKAYYYDGKTFSDEMYLST